MSQPNEAQCERMVAFWRTAYNSSSELGEKANAFAALKRLQRDLKLSDVEVAFICEETIVADSAPPDEPPDALRVVLGVFDELHVIFPSLARKIVVALWAMHAWVFELFLHSPRLLVQSLEPECGKTTLLMCLEQLVRSPRYSADFTAPTLYRYLENRPDTTFLLDEIDNSTLWSSDKLLLKFLNQGHRQGGKVPRTIGGEIVDFPCFAPLALAGIARYRFPPATLTRSIVIDLEQRLDEGCDEIWPDHAKCANGRIAIAGWASTFQRRSDARIPFRGRTKDNWRVLIEIAESLSYGETARAVARAIHGPEDNPVVRLLGDIHQIFETRKIDRIWTDDLLPLLHGLEGAAWDEFWGISGDEDPHPLTKAELYRMLKTKKVHSRSVWIGEGDQRVSRKGFLREQFKPVWRELFPGTPSRPSNVVALPRHQKRPSGGTDGDDIDDAEGATGGES